MHHTRTSIRTAFTVELCARFSANTVFHSRELANARFILPLFGLCTAHGRKKLFRPVYYAKISACARALRVALLAQALET